jgi:small subunit ribosomal protein S4e
MSHLKTINAPKIWPVKKKKTKFVVRSHPGPHPIDRGITLNLLLKEVLSFAKTTREVKKILNGKQIMVDKILRKEHKFPVGVMDVIDVPKTKKYYRLLINEKKKLIANEIKETNSNLKPLKIIGKKILKKNKIQINLFDGKNILVDKDPYKVGDTVIYNLSTNKIESHLKLDKKAKVFITDGKYQGRIGEVQEIKKETKDDRIVVKDKKNNFETLKKYAFVIDEKVIE